LTSKTIVIKWTNPTQYHTGLTGPTTMDLINTSPLVTTPTTGTSPTGGQIWFPVVNRIMIQIKNSDNNTYQTWGDNSSTISKNIVDMSYGRVICEKDRIIPPASSTVNTITYYFGPTYDYNSKGPRVNRVYKLDNFANSIILYKNKSIPENLEGTDVTKEKLVEKRVYSAKQNDDNENNKYTLPDSEEGFEISIWLENQYEKDGMNINDFNIVRLTKMNRIMDENGNEITSSSNNELLKSQIGEPIRFLTVDPPTKIRVADYGATDGFHVKLKRITNTTIHYLECIIPKDAVNPADTSKKNEDDIKVKSTQSAGQENEVYFKGYFIEYQTIEADADENATKTLTELEAEFNKKTTWTFVTFETFSSDKNGISFSKAIANNTDSNKTMATDAQAELGTDTYPDGTTNINNYGFISAAPYSGGFSTKTSDISWNVSKAFRLNQGDNKFYRFRIRGLNSGNKKTGPVSEKYFYFRFNEPDQITWNTTPPKFKANQLSWDITLNWDSIGYSSKTDVSGSSYTVSELAIMEYKLQRRDSASELWQTISYWKNTATNSQLTTHNYEIWPTPSQTIDNSYNTISDWETSTNTNKAGWVYYEETNGGTKIYTQEARLLATDQSTQETYKTRNPSFQFRIQARNYLFGKRVDSKNNNNIVTTTKQWFIEGTEDSTNNKNITDSRWSVDSSASTQLLTTSHTSSYTPTLQDNNNDKYEIKFYEQNSADTNSPWKNSNNVTDYDTESTRLVKYTNNPNRTTNTNKPYNNTPDKDYISYQWKLSGTNTTADSTTGLTIDRYVIEETIQMGTSSDSTDLATTNPTTIIYSPDFRYGPANWHINEYTPFISASPSFKFKVRAFNFFNSNSSIYSSDSTELTPIEPSSPRYLSSSAISGVDGKENSNPTFALTDEGITILVDEPEFTGQIPRNLYQYQDQALSISEFALQDIRLDSGSSAPTGEINLINGNGSTSRSGTSIQGNDSQVATFYHPNGYTETPPKALKDLNNGKVEYTFHAKNVLKNTFSTTSSCTLTIGKPNPGVNFKYCPKFTWVLSTNKVKLEFFRKATTSSSVTEILKDDPNIDTTDESTVAPLSAVTNNCKFSNTVKKLAWEVQCNTAGWTVITAIPNTFITNTSFTTTGDNSHTTSAYDIPNIYIENQTIGIIYTIDYKVRNQYNANYFASNASSDIGDKMSPLQIKLDVPVWTSNNNNNVFTSQFTYGVPTANSGTTGNKIVISWKRPTHGGLYFKHEGDSKLSEVSSPKIKSYKIYLKATNLIPTSTHTYYICTITQNRVSGEYKDVFNSPTPEITIYSGGSTSPLTSNGNDTQTIVIKKITGGSDTDYYNGTETTISNFRFKPEHEYTVEKITAINWLYGTESANMNSGIKTKYQNGINGGTTTTTPTITSLTSVQINLLEKVNYPPIGSNNYIATNVVPAVPASTSSAGIAPAVTGPNLNTFSQYPNNGSLISGAGISSTKNEKINKLAGVNGTTVTNIIINKDYAKIPNGTVGMSIRLGVKIGDGNETFTNFCTFTNSTCNNKSLKYIWGTGTTASTIATITANNPVDIYTGDNLSYWFASSSIKISTASTINDVTAFYGKSVVFKVYVYYHSSSNAYNNNNNKSESTATFTLTNSPDSDYYDKGGLGVPTAKTGTIAYTGTQVYTVLGLPILKSGKMPSITYNFDNKSTKWALHTDKKVLDVKLGKDTNSVLSTTNTDNSKHNWTTKNNVSLTSNTSLNIEFPDSTKTSLVKDAQLFVKATNIVGTQAAWFSGWSVTTKFIYDPNTLTIINIINGQAIADSNLKIDTGNNATNWNGNIPTGKENFTVLKVPANFNPSEQFINKFTVKKIDLTEDLRTLNDNNKRNLLIYDGKFVSEKYFKEQFTNGSWSTTNQITNEYNNYQSNVKKIINVLPASTSTTLQSYIGTGNVNTDNLKTDYRWSIFQYQVENIVSDKSYPAAYPLYIQFKLGSGTNIGVSDLYNSGSKLSKVEIWSKLRSGTNESRWNKLVHSDKSFRQDVDNYSDRVIYSYNTDQTATKQPSSSWYLPKTNNFSSWTSNNSDNLIKIRIGKDNNIRNIFQSSSRANGDGTNKIQLFLAIGLHNAYSKCIEIPKATNKLFE